MIIPNVKLLIGGEICTKIRLINPDVYLMGMCEDPKDFYKLGDISINPEMSGTGFKIKIIESLHFGKPVISSEIGIRGLRDRSIQECPLLIAENAQDYIQCIRFLSDQENYLDNQNKCTEYIYKITDQATSDLTNALDTYSLDK
jgi:glycosyltransferase involved in cell wall biosynthesis